MQIGYRVRVAIMRDKNSDQPSSVSEGYLVGDTTHFWKISWDKKRLDIFELVPKFSPRVNVTKGVVIA